MALGHRRSFKIVVHAKICKLYIKLKATLKPPPVKFKFQRLLKLDKLLIEVDSKSESRILIQRQRTLKSRMLSFVKKHLGRRGSKNQSWHIGSLEVRCVGGFGVGLGYLLAIKSHITNGFTSFIWVALLLLILLLYLWLNKCKYLFQCSCYC